MDRQPTKSVLPARRHHWSGRFDAIDPWRARGILALLLLLMAYGVWLSMDQRAPGTGDVAGDSADRKLYEGIVARVHAGEPYYAVVGDELRTRGYALRPAFNWRLPTLALFLGALPDPAWGRAAMILLVAITWIAWAVALRREQYVFARIGGCALMILTLVSFVGPTAYYFHETWAAILIALCLAARASGALWLCFLAAILAVAIRELAVVPIGVLLLAAAWERRRVEVVGWLVLLLLFCGGVTLHFRIVGELLRPDDPGNRWTGLGGWNFVLNTAVWSGPLLLMPPWALALLVPACLAGLGHWRSPLGTRVGLCTGAYVLAFLVVGRPDNFYWGMMYAPVLALGLLFFPNALGCLWRSACSTAPGDRAAPSPS